MKRFNLLFLIAIAGMLTGSCSRKIMFTPELRKELESNNIPLTEVQFYNSHKIELNRTHIPPDAISINSGAVNVERGKYIEEVVIRKHTPGVCSSVNPYDLSIEFEPDNHYSLKFGRKAGAKLTNAYKLYAKWKADKGEIIYGDSKFTTKMKATNAHLLVEKKQVYNLIRDKRVARGVKVDQMADEEASDD